MLRLVSPALALLAMLIMSHIAMTLHLFSSEASVTITGSDEEFVAPFASWMCARSSASGTCGAAAAQYCNAAADGVTDDTTAIQNCIDSLSSTKPVIYFP